MTRALVVDDSRAMRTILRNILKELDYEVVEAAHGIEGLEQLKAVEDISLALVDWNMPEMDGYEFVKAVRANHDYAEMHVVMVSAENDMGKIARALMVGADEYAMKPISKEVIVEKLQLIGAMS